MIYRDKLGNERRVHPKGPEFVLVVCKPDEGITKSGLLLAAHEHFPITQGFIAELPLDRSYIERHKYPLELNTHVIFHRYASGTDETLVVEDHFYDELNDLHTVDRIYTLNVDDIIVVLDYDFKEYAQNG